MPYSSIAELPDAVKERYSPRCQKVFMDAFNRAVRDSGPGGALSEEKAFKVAHTAAGLCKDATKAEWDTAYINDLPDSAFACIDAGGEKEDGKTVPRTKRHYPHHKADGSLDLPHLRNALSRVAQEDTTTCGVAHLRAHAKEADVGKAAPLNPDETQAWFAGKIPRRLLAIPFGGPIPMKGAPLGVDLDGEWFSEKTDIKADWFSERPVLWHHGIDPSGKMGATALGKATNLSLEEDGWWVDLWLKAGEDRIKLVRRLMERGAELFGSSATIPHLVKRGKAGHIEVWPYIEQTLSTSPQNTKSVLTSAKAALDAFDLADITVVPAVRDVLTELDLLRDLHPAFASSQGVAKAGREPSGATVAEIEEWMEALDAVLKRARSFRDGVLSKYQPKQED